MHNLRDDEHPRGFQDQVPVEHIVLVEKVSCGEVAAMRHAKVDAYQLAPWRGHEQREALRVKLGWAEAHDGVIHRGKSGGAGGMGREILEGTK